MSESSVSAWDAEAATFDLTADHGLTSPHVRRAWTRLLRRVLPPSPCRIADLGCGTGSLSILAAELGHHVDGVDFSPQMVQIAAAKAGANPRVSFRLGDASSPPLSAGYDVVLVRHVLWALPDQAGALRAWIQLLQPQGFLVLIEGHWSTGVGLNADDAASLLRDVGLQPAVEPLTDSDYWGGPITDHRYLASAVRRGSPDLPEPPHPD